MQQPYPWHPKGETVDGSEPGERLGQAVDEDDVGVKQRVERRSKYVLSFVLDVHVFVRETDLRRPRSQVVGRDGAAMTAPAQSRHQLPGAVAAAGLDGEEYDEVEDALAGHYDEDSADAGQLQTEVVFIARHAQRAAVI